MNGWRTPMRHNRLMMTILGISAFYHDSAAAIIQDGKILAAAQEERFTRKKNDASFPVNAIRFCLEFAESTINELDAVVFYDKPLLKFERLLETYYANAPRGLISFITAMPVWLKEKLFLKKIIYDSLGTIEKFDKKKIKLLFPEHHLSHAASAFYPSPFEKAAIVTIDGVGEWATMTICLGEGNQIKVIKQQDFPHSVGLLYSAFTYYCGFKVNSGEYKLMGLAPYGNIGSDEVEKYKDIIKTSLIRLQDDGSVYLHQEYFTYATHLRMVNDKKWNRLFGFPRREPESPIEQKYCDLALAIQEVTEEIVLGIAKEARRLTGADQLCMAGGVALNAAANGKLENEKIFGEIFIQPAAGDAGGALGAAYAAYHIYFGKERQPVEPKKDAMQGSLLGPEYSVTEIKKMTKKFAAVCTEVDNEDELVRMIAVLIGSGKIVGWHQGRMEFGPRALGARSVLADARNPDMQKRLNLDIKYRESFRPFAPAVLMEDSAEYFDHQGTSPYMLLIKPIKKQRQIAFPDHFRNNSLYEKLYFQRSDLPAITHVDYSARIQTVQKDINNRFWKLINAFKELTGCSVLINTSFNVRGEPLVNTPEESYRCFMHTEMDYLVIGNFIFDKILQPAELLDQELKKNILLD